MSIKNYSHLSEDYRSLIQVRGKSSPDIRKYIARLDKRIFRANKKGLRHVSDPDYSTFFWIRATQYKTEVVEGVKEYYTSKGFSWEVRERMSSIPTCPMEDYISLRW